MGNKRNEHKRIRKNGDKPRFLLNTKKQKTMEKTLGGDRLGSGNKMKVDLRTYNRSTHDRSYIFRTTAASGTLIPCIKQVALPGDTFEINLNMDIMTHPTLGPLFGSYKAQVDVFMAPIRLYQAWMQINLQQQGLKMNQVKLPLMKFRVPETIGWTLEQYGDIDNYQVNPSCILSYLGVRGFGTNRSGSDIYREFNAVPLLAYWDIYKNYYANQQEGKGYVIHTVPGDGSDLEISGIEINGTALSNTATNPGNTPWPAGAEILIHKVTPATIDLNQIMVMAGNTIGLHNLRPIGAMMTVINETATELNGISNGNWINGFYWEYSSISHVNADEMNIQEFPLENLDQIKKDIMAHVANTSPFTLQLNSPAEAPLGNLFTGNATDTKQSVQFSQEGLALKTYNSDLLNNWLNKESIDGAGGINEITAIDTSSGEFTIDTLNLAKKVYDMLNRIQVSGGTIYDWIDVNWTEMGYRQAISPIYYGSLIKELVFEEVVSQSGVNLNNGISSQPLGTLAGKGRMGSKHKGGRIEIKVEEPSYIMGIFSLTPRQDNSQGNDWDIHLQTMDDFHKPALDEIGFQDLPASRMAWWADYYDSGWITPVVGKQPAWIEYMTEINKVRGNFARKGNEMFMTLNRQYQALPVNERIDIEDLTTYIDPRKYNQIFAETSLDSQNFWVQIGIDMKVRQYISAKLMPTV